MTEAPDTIGKYVLCGELAKGGMATIHIGHAIGSDVPVAIKRLHAHGATPELITMFLDELALAQRIRHPNVVPTIEVVTTDDDLCLVMEYIEGETFSKLLRACREQSIAMPIPVACGITIGALNGLHAAHEATDERGRPLEIVHRDVSPQNVIVGIDGVARVLDFGVAKASVRLAQTRTGELKGKVAYMAPEQLDRQDVTRLTDVYAMGIVLWEALAGRRLFEADTEGQLVASVLRGVSTPPSRHRSEVPPELDAVVLRALSPEPEARFPTARHFAGAVELATSIARPPQISEWVEQIAEKTLEARAKRVARLLGRLDAPASSPSLPASRPSIPSAVASAPSPLRSPHMAASTPSIASSSSLRSPLRSASQPGGVPAPPSSSSELMTSPGTATIRKSPEKHVLIIDDSQVILDRARAALEAEGYRVTTTTQTVGAARHLVDCDLALIDYHMPGFNGASVIQSLRAASSTSGRSCLFYLYTSDPAVAKDYARAGFDGSLTGKGDDEALVRGVRAAFRVLQMRAMKK